MKQWRVGSISAGLVLVMLGVLLLGSAFWGISAMQWLLKAWPITLLLLGLEILAFQFVRKNEKLKFDGISLVLLVLVILSTLIIYPIQQVSVLLSVLGKETQTAEVDRSLDLPDSVKKVVVDVPSSDLTITGNESDKLHVQGSQEIRAVEKVKKDSDQHLQVKVLGDTAVIRQPEQNWGLLSIPFITHSQLDIRLPENMELKVTVANGDVTVNNIHSNIQLDNANGNIAMNNIKGNISADSANGDIHTQKTKGEIWASTANGNINLTQATVTGDWKVETDNGDIRIFLDKEPDALVSGESDLGNLKGNIPWKSGKATLGSGKHQMDLETAAGSIQVQVPDK
ncbi:DUF4097 domain-containing protein [Kroppenstedtia pulmonis]|uniref:DUF4097 domain-containing protein n=1 Tax=Kroppenstedtia pulmonis TaxID=1380685 RepID=A0A7D3Y069_9BACL|nr:DUF4097 family beta strand repeat-containing protein [Kroppenstedtia pulmonis]QKG83483.1 DUF4097 domain-containing protein [Kroppenstedtia pulmonis]